MDLPEGPFRSSPYPRELPAAGADRLSAPRPRRAPTGTGERRAIHVSGYDREGRDFYATPDWVTKALLLHVQFRGPVWEPCCGDGAMSTVLTAHGYKVISTDIAERGFGTPGIDFLTCQKMPEGCRTIVTNPPYGDTGSHRGQARSSAAMLKFLRHSLALAASVQGQLALLVRLQWIAGQRTAEVLSNAPFAAAVVLTRRIQWFAMGERTNHAQHHHAWVVFDHARPVGLPPVMLYA
jgi:predicted RNA methylase